MKKRGTDKNTKRYFCLLQRPRRATMLQLSATSENRQNIRKQRKYFHLLHLIRCCKYNNTTHDGNDNGSLPRGHLSVMNMSITHKRDIVRTQTRSLSFCCKINNKLQLYLQRNGPSQQAG